VATKSGKAATAAPELAASNNRLARTLAVTAVVVANFVVLQSLSEGDDNA
jgi:hypothetical protein